MDLVAMEERLHLREWVRLSRWLKEDWQVFMERPVRQRMLLAAEFVDFMSDGDDPEVASGGGAGLPGLDD